MNTLQVSAQNVASRLIPIVGAMVLSAIPLLAAKGSVSYLFPDYGDLWRWALHIHVDGVLTSQELFSEANLIGHNQVVTIWLSDRIAAGGADYSLLWWLGFGGVLLSAGALAYTTHRALDTHQVPAAVAAIAAVVVGLFGFRFDTGVAYFNSLLVFEQLFYFFALAALLIAAALQAKHLAGERVSDLKYGFLALALVLSEAPGAVSLVAVLGMAALGALALGQWKHLSRVGAAVALSLLCKWLLRSVAGGQGIANGPSSTFGFLDPRAIPDWLELTGSSIVSLATDRSRPAPGGTYLVFGIAVLCILLATLFCIAREVRRDNIGDATLHLAVTGAMLVSFSILAAMFIIAARGDALSGRYDISRFVRSTQFTMAGVAMIGLALVTGSKRSRPARSVVIAIILLSVLLARSSAALGVQDEAFFVARATAIRDEEMCSLPVGDFDWKKYWVGASDAVVDEFEQSELFATWRSEKCP